MPLLPRKGVLAIAANGRTRPVSAKSLAARHQLPSRHLEPVLQALVRDGILRGIRGPHGGYEIARAQITADEILRSANKMDEDDDPQLPNSNLVGEIVLPALEEAERHFSIALARITIDEMAREAEGLREHERPARVASKGR
jgi:Rrf2 family iron-sulfur cluster assembly transcriptional regulator